jgi:hypothetical protein
VKSSKSILLIALLLCCFAAGCATTETENVSERPWNTPKGWEHGLPGGMMPRY